MNEIKDLSVSFEDTIKDSDLQKVTIDLAETITDSLLNNGLLREIPIIGTIVGLTKASFNISERLFIKKIMYFLSEIRNINVEERNRLISEIENSDKQRIKVGEKLLYILDKCDDHITAKYLAIAFTAFLHKELTYSEFLRCSNVIQKLFIYDLELFINTDVSKLEVYVDSHGSGLSDFQNSLISSGICATEIDGITVDDEDDYESGRRYKVDGGSTYIYLSEIGLKLKNILKKNCS